MDPQGKDAGKQGSQGQCAAPDFPVSFSIVALAHSHRALAAQLLRPIGLYPGQELILLQLWQQGCQSQNSLGQALRVDHSTIAKSVRRLECSGLVTRSRSPEDGRITVVSLTTVGLEAASRVREIWTELEHLTSGGLNEQEKTAFTVLARKIQAMADASLHCEP